jgi:hypothetical protein
MDLGFQAEGDCGLGFPCGRVVFCEAYGDRSSPGDRAPIHLFVDTLAADGRRSELAVTRRFVARKDEPRTARSTPMISNSTLSQSARPFQSAERPPQWVGLWTRSNWPCAARIRTPRGRQIGTTAQNFLLSTPSVFLVDREPLHNYVGFCAAIPRSGDHTIPIGP